MSVFKRIRNGQPSETYFIKFLHKGKQKYIKTPFTNKLEAERHQAKLIQALDKEGWSALDTIQPPRAEPVPHTTIAELIQHYRAEAPGNREIAANTIKTNIYALYNILRTAGRVTIPDEEDEPHADKHYAHLTTAVLNASLIVDYKKAVTARAMDLADEDIEAAQSLYRSANSILRTARSIFAHTLMDYYQDQKLNLPDLKPFLDRSGFIKVRKIEYNPAPDPLLHKTLHVELPKLEATELNCYLAIWLTIGFGLRKAEIGALTPFHFHLIDNRPTVILAGIKAKNKEIGARIGCQHDAWEKLLPHIIAAQKANQPYLLTGSRTDRTWDTFRRVSAWMRALGWETQKTIHEFRAWSGSKIAEAHGFLAARDFMRHGTQNTTEQYYGRYIRSIIPHTPLRIPTLLAPQIMQLQEANA